MVPSSLTSIRALDRAGSHITFAAVAQQAHVSRSWLYRQPEVGTEIDRLRKKPPPPNGSRPSAERATPQSQQQRLETLLDANRALRADNDALRRRVDALLGEQRAAANPPSARRGAGPRH
jgi:Family of unknown function (DUF6262)